MDKNCHYHYFKGNLYKVSFDKLVEYYDEENKIVQNTNSEKVFWEIAFN